GSRRRRPRTIVQDGPHRRGVPSEASMAPAWTTTPELLLATSSLRWSSVAGLALTSLAVMGSPGPATISLTASGVAFGVRRSGRSLAGIIAGTALVLLAVAAGLTGALLAIPALRPAILAVGAGYILVLAYRIARAPPLRAAAAGATAPSLRGGLL